MIVTRVSDNSDHEPARFRVVYDAPRERFIAVDARGAILAEVPATRPTAEHPARELLARALRRGPPGFSHPNRGNNPTLNARRSARMKAMNAEGVRSIATTDEPHTEDEFEFLKAMEAFQARTGIKFPTWSHTLKVLKALGYHR